MPKSFLSLTFLIVKIKRGKPVIKFNWVLKSNPDQNSILGTSLSACRVPNNSFFWDPVKAATIFYSSFHPKCTDIFLIIIRKCMPL